MQKAFHRLKKIIPFDNVVLVTSASFGQFIWFSSLALFLRCLLRILIIH